MCFRHNILYGKANFCNFFDMSFALVKCILLRPRQVSIYKLRATICVLAWIFFNIYIWPSACDLDETSEIKFEH